MRFVTNQLTYHVRVSLECPKFYYEIGHYDAQGIFHQHVVSGFMFDSYGEAERAALPMIDRVQNAMQLRLRRLARAA